MTDEELAREWLLGLTDASRFYPLVAPDCAVWHSSDNNWMPVKDAIDAFAAGGGLQELSDTSYTVMNDGFLVQFSATVGGAELHNTIIVKTRDGLAISAEEYIGMELDHEALAAAHAAAAAVGTDE